MRLFRTRQAIYAEWDGNYYLVSESSWDKLVTHDDLYNYLAGIANHGQSVEALEEHDLVAPIGTQEVWAAGVTYFRSRNARMEESKDAGGGSFYDRVYSAERPELFFKSTPSRVVGPGQPVRIRRDASWSVPEPELTLVINQHGKIIGYTAGNDMSSRDIEGENPLYLPQAKVYDGSCALGPSVLITPEPLPSSTVIRIEIARDGETAFSGETSLAEMKRAPQLLVDYLYRECSFPSGAYLMTGTGIIPPDTFSLRRNDEVRITIEGIGTLRNRVDS